MRKIAIYGKGGIGKSTIAANVAVALAKQNYTVMQIGCDPKQDSTMNLVGGFIVPSILELISEVGVDNVALEDCCFEGAAGVIAAEAGGPEPGIGCAGRGVITALTFLKEKRAFEAYGVEVVIFDVLGDVVCGGFAMPLREGFANEVYIVTSAEVMSLYAANNISLAVCRFQQQGLPLVLGGLIAVSRHLPNEFELIDKFAAQINLPVVAKIPRSLEVQRAEAQGKTVVQQAPYSAQAQIYFSLSQKMMQTSAKELKPPKPMTRLAFLDWHKKESASLLKVSNVN